MTPTSSHDSTGTVEVTTPRERKAIVREVRTLLARHATTEVALLVALARAKRTRAFQDDEEYRALIAADRITVKERDLDDGFTAWCRHCLGIERTQAWRKAAAGQLIDTLGDQLLPAGNSWSERSLRPVVKMLAAAPDPVLDRRARYTDDDRDEAIRRIMRAALKELTIETPTGESRTDLSRLGSAVGAIARTDAYLPIARLYGRSAESTAESNRRRRDARRRAADGDESRGERIASARQMIEEAWSILVAEDAVQLAAQTIDELLRTVSEPRS